MRYQLGAMEIGGPDCDVFWFIEKTTEPLDPGLWVFPTFNAARKTAVAICQGRLKIAESELRQAETLPNPDEET